MRPPEFPPSWEESEVGGGDFVAPPRHLYCRGDTYRHGVPRHMEALKARGSAAPKRTPGGGEGAPEGTRGRVE